MKKINKIIITLFICWCCINCITLGDNSDCWKFAELQYKQEGSAENGFNIVNLSRWTSTNIYSNFLTIDEQSAIIDKESLNTALLNLKKYCCTNELWWLKQQYKTCQDDKEFYNDNALDSEYLFDHIFDVIIRRLTWLTWVNDIYTKTNMTVDKKWEERRARISEQALNTSWTNPQTIIDQYQKVREQSPSSTWYNIKDKIYDTFYLSDQDFLAYVSWQWSSEKSDESKKVAEAFKNYDKRTLYDRYDNACALSEYFYALLDLWVTSSDKNTIRYKLSDWACSNLVKQQIQQENYYVKEVIQRQTNLFMENYITTYLSYYQNRTDTLKDTWSKAKDKLLDVVRAIPKLIQSCVK